MYINLHTHIYIYNRCFTKVVHTIYKFCRPQRHQLTHQTAELLPVQKSSVICRSISWRNERIL